MPKLLVFLPCENVLLSGADGQTASLIVIFNQIIFQGPLPADLPRNAAAPRRWFTFTQWEMFPADVGIEYRQRVVFEDGHGNMPIEAITNFSGEEGKSLHRIVMSNVAFPMLEPGIYRLHLSLQAPGEEIWTEVADYPITITVTPAAEAIQAEG